MSESEEPSCHWCAGYPNNLSRGQIIRSGGKAFLANEYVAHMRSNCSVAIKQREAEENTTPFFETTRRASNFFSQIVIMMLKQNQIKIKNQ